MRDKFPKLAAILPVLTIKICFMQTFTENLTAIKLTEQEAIKLGIDPNEEEQKGHLETFGHWNIPVSFKTVCVASLYVRNEWGIPTKVNVTVFGLRTMTNLRQTGYELEGYVSIKGKKYTCFTSSELFEINGKLVNVATINARFNLYPKD